MNNMSSAFGANAGSAIIHEGDNVPEIPEILTEEVGFKGLNGDKKAKILSEPWPSDDLPPPYASLLSIASAQGLYAAGGPSSLVIGKTEEVRNRIYSESKSEDIFDSQPLQVFPHQRLTHVAFASNETCLVIAEQGSAEIVAYDVKGLLAGNQKFKITLSTNAPIRAVLPNPDPVQAHLFALLNTKGQVLLANLQGKAELQSGVNGPVLAENATCLAWSTKGKQLIAGKANGTAVQLKPDGTIVANIPKPVALPEDCHLAQIAWVETDIFIFIYTQSTLPDGENPESHFYVVKTNKARSEFTFRKTANDIVFATIPRAPAHFHTARLRGYGPNLDELLCITATVSPDIKMITKSKEPLSGEMTEGNAYALTEPDNESLRAAMPMNMDDSEDTSAIGMAIDLSDNEPILQPIVGDPEVPASDGPLPMLAALNNEGILRIWVIVYNQAIREKVPYPGFADVAAVRDAIGNEPDDGEEMETAISQSPAMTRTEIESSNSNPAPVFPPSSTGIGSPFGKPNATPSVVNSSSGGVFGKPAQIGSGNKTSWTSTGFDNNPQTTASGFGTIGFGTTPTLGSNAAPGFGRTGAMGGIGLQNAATPAFGKTGFGSSTGQSSPFASGSKSSSSPFASAGANTGSGFSSFANQNGFAAAKSDSKTESPFRALPSGNSFGSGSGSSASPFATAGSKSSGSFAQLPSSSTFGKPNPISSSFGGSTTLAASPFSNSGKPGFKLDSTFKKDETSNDDDNKLGDSGFSFGGFDGLETTLGPGASKLPQTANKEAEMEDDNDAVGQIEAPKKPQETPPSTLSQPKTTTTPHVASLFGNQQHQSTTPPTQQKSGTNWSFGGIPSTTPKDTPAPTRLIFGTQPVPKTTPALVAQSEPNKPFAPIPSVSKEETLRSNNKAEGASPQTKIPEVPLPPDPFSKPGYQTGDTSASSLNSKTSREAEDAPLPPDFISAGKSAVQSLKTEDSALHSDNLSSTFGESGDDLTGEASGEDHESDHSAEDDAEQVQTSPESSFGHAADQSPVVSPTGGPFTKVSRVEATKPMKPLFGELGKPGPMFAPPKPQPQQSPRSPSPVRKSSSNDLFRPSDRSVSAPAVAKTFLQQKKLEHQQSQFAIQAAKAREEEAAKEAARMEAARRAREEVEAREQQPLVDDEDTIIRMALAQAPEPKEWLDPFMTIQPVKALQDLSDGRIDIHSQIEKLFEDINSMVNTLGINARSLQEYMMYQNNGEVNQVWPKVLSSETPMDALNDEQFLSDINNLPAGCTTLDEVLESLQIKDMVKKLDDCQNLLTQELTDLRARITVMRRTTQARAQAKDNENAPLSAEQSSIQQDLRKLSATVLSNLGQVEDELVILRAKLADLVPSRQSVEKSTMFSLGSSGRKKPSVEAVFNTVSKMMAMAEKKSADVDVLEAQLRKLQVESKETQPPRTPERRVARRTASTPGSGASSIYHTPESRGKRSVLGTPSRSRQLVVLTEDRDKWQTKARRRKEVAASLKAVLQAKHGKPVA